MSSLTVDLATIEDLVLNKGYVFLKTDSGYDESKKNSIKDHYGLTTMQAQAVKRDPVIRTFIKSLSSVDIKIVDSRVNINNNNANVTAEPVANVEMV